MSKKKDSPGKSNGDGMPPQAEVPTQADAPLGEAATRAKASAQLSVLGQYIKDLSFESPNAPQVLQTPGENPQLQVSVNVAVNAKQEDAYEVTLNLEVRAKSDAGVIYIVELAYCGLFRLRNIPENLLQPVLFIDCPTILFPFMRRVLSDITKDGGFPPLMLDPIDFGRLYAEKMQRAQPAQGQPQAKN
jgi:preprotein translocase subunit SecB